MKRVLLQPAYVLHRRPYRETSCLLELFTQEHGRVSVVAKGVNKPRTAWSGLLQPFIPLLVSFSGKSDLLSVNQVEANGVLQNLQADCLFAGFYLNELLMCLLQKWDAHANLYLKYEKTLYLLQSAQLDEKVLRSFELTLLNELGYGILPKTEISLHNTFSSEKWYRFIPEHGFLSCDLHELNAANSFSGKNLMAMAREDWHEEGCLADAKRLIRFVLAPLLGDRTIHSRRLFMQPGEEQNEK